MENQTSLTKHSKSFLEIPFGKYKVLQLENPALMNGSDILFQLFDQTFYGKVVQCVTVPNGATVVDVLTDAGYISTSLFLNLTEYIVIRPLYVSESNKIEQIKNGSYSLPELLNMLSVFNMTNNHPLLEYALREQSMKFYLESLSYNRSKSNKKTIILSVPVDIGKANTFNKNLKEKKSLLFDKECYNFCFDKKTYTDEPVVDKYCIFEENNSFYVGKIRRRSNASIFIEMFGTDEIIEKSLQHVKILIPLNGVEEMIYKNITSDKVTLNFLYELLYTRNSETPFHPIIENYIVTKIFYLYYNLSLPVNYHPSLIYQKIGRGKRDKSKEANIIEVAKPNVIDANAMATKIMLNTKYQVNTLGTEIQGEITHKPNNPSKLTNYTREELLQVLRSDVEKTIQNYLSFEQIKNNTELKDLVESIGNDLKTDMFETSKRFGKMIICVSDYDNYDDLAEKITKGAQENLKLIESKINETLVIDLNNKYDEITDVVGYCDLRTFVKLLNLTSENVTKYKHVKMFKSGLGDIFVQEVFALLKIDSIIKNHWDEITISEDLTEINLIRSDK